MLTTSLAMILSHTIEEAKEIGTSSIFTHQCGGRLGLNTPNRSRDIAAPVEENSNMFTSSNYNDTRLIGFFGK